MKRWKEYTEELYHTEKRKHLPIDEETEIMTDDKGPDLLTEEIVKVMESLSNGKAEGIDNIPVE